MKHFERFLSVHKFLFVILIIFSLPFAFTWAIVYGVIVGLIGITVDCWESTRSMIRREKWEALKYAKWSEKDYQQRYLDNIKNYGARLLKEQEFKQGDARVPKPWARISAHLIIGIIFFFYLILWGVVTGPIRAFLLFTDWCAKVWSAKLA